MVMYAYPGMNWFDTVVEICGEAVKCDNERLADIIVEYHKDKRNLVINKMYEEEFREALAKLRSECKTDLRLEVVDDED